MVEPNKRSCTFWQALMVGVGGREHPLGGKGEEEWNENLGGGSWKGDTGWNVNK